MPSAAPAICPAHSPQVESALRISLSRMATNCQGWVFFEDCERRLAFRMALTTSSGKAFSSNWCTVRLVRMASDTFLRIFLLGICLLGEIEN